jgi:hypothetical protein
MLAIFLVLGTRVFRSAGYTGIAQRSSGRTSFLVTSQASGQSFAVGSRDSSTKQTSGHRDFGTKSGSSDPVAQNPVILAYRLSGVRGEKSLVISHPETPNPEMLISALLSRTHGYGAWS